MTQTFTSDSTNDLTLGGNGNLSISTGLQGVLHACATAAKAQLGEMVLSTNKGVPNFQTVWSSRRNIAQFESYLRATLERVAGVKKVNELEVTTDGSVLRYGAQIETDYGTGALTQ